MTTADVVNAVWHGGLIALERQYQHQVTITPNNRFVVLDDQNQAWLVEVREL